jgi:hypothetical protein
VRGRTGRLAVASMKRLGIAVLATTATQATAVAATVDVVDGITYVSKAANNVDEGSSKLLRGVCPSGEKIVGFGGVANGASASIDRHLAGLYPIDGPDGNSKRDDGAAVKGFSTDGVMSLAQQTVCVSGQAEVATESGAMRPDQSKTLKATCPVGFSVTAGGARSPDADPAKFRLFASAPFDGGDDDADFDDGWRVTGFNHAGGGRELIVYAVCRDATPAYQPYGPLALNSVRSGGTELCPTEDHLFSVGARPSGSPDPDISISGLSLADYQDSAEPDQAPDDFARFAIENRSDESRSVVFPFICGP